MIFRKFVDVFRSTIMQINQPCCAYCGCSSIDCLAIDKATGMYFCNGKGSTQDSHIIHHLNSIHSAGISLPPENSYSNVSFVCYCCNSSNIFNLVFINSPETGKGYIICEGCRYEPKILSERVDQNTIVPIVSNGYINTNVLRIPEEHEYKRIPISKTLPIIQLSQERMGINSTNNNFNNNFNNKNNNNNSAFLTYSNLQQYFQHMETLTLAFQFHNLYN